MKPYSRGCRNGHDYVRDEYCSTLLRLTPWALVVAGTLGLSILVYTQLYPSAEANEVKSTDRASEITQHLALQEAAINSLTSKLDNLADGLGRSLAIVENTSSPRNSIRDIDTGRRASTAIEKDKTLKKKAPHRATVSAQSRAGVEDDLDKLRTYVKDVANSVALLDAEVSDPAVLQKKLEHQKAIAQP